MLILVESPINDQDLEKTAEDFEGYIKYIVGKRTLIKTYYYNASLKQQINPEILPPTRGVVFSNNFLLLSNSSLKPNRCF